LLQEYAFFGIGGFSPERDEAKAQCHWNKLEYCRFDEIEPTKFEY